MAAFSAKSLHNYKFCPHVSRADNVFGDRNSVCSCVRMEKYSSWTAKHTKDKRAAMYLLRVLTVVINHSDADTDAQNW